MTPLSWLYMGSVWATIIALNIFCFGKIFKNKNGNNGDSENQK